MTRAADWVLDGRVLTLDRKRPRAEALAVRDGCIVAVGRRGDVRGWREPPHVRGGPARRHRRAGP